MLITLSHLIHSRLHSILGPALAVLRFAPVETAKAVHITVAGTASMVGEALHQTTSTISAATEESVQQIARRTHTEKVGKTGRPLGTHSRQILPVFVVYTVPNDVHTVSRVLCALPQGRNCPHRWCHAMQVVTSTRQRWREATADVPKVRHCLPRHTLW